MTTRLRSERWTRLGRWARFWMGRAFRLAFILMTFATRAQSVPNAATAAAWGAEPAFNPDRSLSDALRSLAARASVAFTGEVIAIHPSGGVVEVQFRVDRVLLGAPGGAYTLREWCGLWSAGRRRFFVGEQATLFLHAAAPGGLASPVDGMDGVLPTIPMGVGEELLVDVRRLQTRVLRPMGTPLDSEGGGAILLSELAGTVAPGTRPGSHEPGRVALPVSYALPARSVDPAQRVLLPGAGPVPQGMRPNAAAAEPTQTAAEPFAVQLRLGAQP